MLDRTRHAISVSGQNINFTTSVPTMSSKNNPLRGASTASRTANHLGCFFCPFDGRLLAMVCISPKRSRHVASACSQLPTHARSAFGMDACPVRRMRTIHSKGSGRAAPKRAASRVRSSRFTFSPTTTSNGRRPSSGARCTTTHRVRSMFCVVGTSSVSGSRTTMSSSTVVAVASGCGGAVIAGLGATLGASSFVGGCDCTESSKHSSCRRSSTGTSFFC